MIRGTEGGDEEKLIKDLLACEQHYEACLKEVQSAKSKIMEQRAQIHAYIAMKQPKVWIVSVTNGSRSQIPGVFVRKEDAVREVAWKNKTFFELEDPQYIERETITVPLEDLVRHLPIAKVFRKYILYYPM